MAFRRSWLLGALLGLLVAWLLGTQGGTHVVAVLGIVFKKSLLCRPGPGPCDVTPEVFGWDRLWFPWSIMAGADWDRLMQSVGRRGVARPERDGLPLIVHVGPNTLDERDVRLHSRLAETLPSGAHFAFVEPQQPVLEDLRRNLAAAPAFGAGNSSAKVSVINAALCPSSSEHLIMHAFSDQFFKEHPWALEQKFNHHVSFNRSWLIGTTRAFRTLPKELLALPEEAWAPYVQELKVRCVTPLSLLNEVEAKPSALDVLVIDAEGYDVELLSMFLAVDGFAPAALIFEWTGHDSTGPRVLGLAKAVRTLAARGYEVHKHINDLIAFLP